MTTPPTTPGVNVYSSSYLWYQSQVPLSSALLGIPWDDNRAYKHLEHSPLWSEWHKYSHTRQVHSLSGLSEPFNAAGSHATGTANQSIRFITEQTVLLYSAPNRTGGTRLHNSSSCEMRKLTCAAKSEILDIVTTAQHKVQGRTG
jgi:hypothetical protein